MLGIMADMGIPTMALLGRVSGTAIRNWNTATHPLRNTTSISISPSAISLYTEDSTWARS